MGGHHWPHALNLGRVLVASRATSVAPGGHGQRYGPSSPSSGPGGRLHLAEIEAALLPAPARSGIVHAEPHGRTYAAMEGIGELCRSHNCPWLLLDHRPRSALCRVFFVLGRRPGLAAARKGLQLPPLAFRWGPARAKAGGSARQVPNSVPRVSAQPIWAYRVYHHTAPVNMTFGMRGLRSAGGRGWRTARARLVTNAERSGQGLSGWGLGCMFRPALPRSHGALLKDRRARLQPFTAQPPRHRVWVGWPGTWRKGWRIGADGYTARREVTACSICWKRSCPVFVLQNERIRAVPCRHEQPSSSVAVSRPEQPACTPWCGALGLSPG